jgi:hypothetical protein
MGAAWSPVWDQAAFLFMPGGNVYGRLAALYWRLDNYSIQTEYRKIELFQTPVTAHTPVCEVINTGFDEEVSNRKLLTLQNFRYIIKQK